MAVKIYSGDEFRLVDLTDDFLKQYHLIVAAGGLVKNDKGKILMIFRRGKWDLPKGKLDKNESLEVCADREIKEETGLTHLVFQKILITTYHTYVEKKEQILKETHWFQFAAPGNQQVRPQTEEDITSIEWVDPEELPKYTQNSYQLIKDVLHAAGY
jgi:8-oxo-dGTP pyrophosphatase MutT (NUDIX family)